MISQSATNEISYIMIKDKSAIAKHFKCKLIAGRTDASECRTISRTQRWLCGVASTASHLACLRRREQGNHTSAIKDFERALQLDPGCAQTWQNSSTTRWGYMTHAPLQSRAQILQSVAGEMRSLQYYSGCSDIVCHNLVISYWQAADGRPEWSFG